MPSHEGGFNEAEAIKPRNLQAGAAASAITIGLPHTMR